MLAASGLNFGLVRTLPHMAGVVVGFLVVVAACAAGIGGVLKAYPAVHAAMKIVGAAYLLWLEDGRPEGRDVDHWLAAKQLLCHRHGRDAQTGRPAVEIAPPAATRSSGRN